MARDTKAVAGDGVVGGDLAALPLTRDELVRIAREAATGPSVSSGDAAFAARLNALFAALAPLGDALRSEIVLDLARYLTPILPHPREEGR